MNELDHMNFQLKFWSQFSWFSYSALTRKAITQSTVAWAGSTMSHRSSETRRTPIKLSASPITFQRHLYQTVSRLSCNFPHKCSSCSSNSNNSSNSKTCRDKRRLCRPSPHPRWSVRTHLAAVGIATTSMATPTNNIRSTTIILIIKAFERWTTTAVKATTIFTATQQSTM